MTWQRWCRYVLPAMICMAAAGGMLKGGTASDAVEPATRPSAAKQSLAAVAKAIRWLPPQLIGPGSEPVGKEHVPALIRCVQEAKELPFEVLKDRDPTVRGIGGLVFALCDDLSRVAAAVRLLDDDAATRLRAVPFSSAPGGWAIEWEQAEVLSVSNLVRRAFKYRWVGGALSPYPFKTTKETESFVKALVAEPGAGGEWLYRFRRARRWKLDCAAIKKELTESTDPLKGLSTAIVAAFLPDEMTEQDVNAALRDTDKAKIKEFLQNGWRMSTMTLEQGPFSKDQFEGRRVLLKVAPHVLDRMDAKWVLEAGNQQWQISTAYIIAAAKLDREAGVPWLRDALAKEKRQWAKCDLLEGVWLVGGETQISFIKDSYFAEKEPRYNAGGLQEDFIDRLCEGDRLKGTLLLDAVVLDRRFTTLGWAATLAFARNANIILGEEPKEVKRYLRVQHRMGLNDFEHRPEVRKKYLVDTKHVLMETEAFQLYLQGEVLKRSPGNDAWKK